jgi:hypothetical protein
MLALLLVPVALTCAGDPAKSRWRSLTSGNLFEVTDYGDRLSVRFLESEVVADQATERSDVAVTVNDPRRQLNPGRWLLQKGADGKYVGTASSERQCMHRPLLALDFRPQVCKLSDPVEISMTADRITGQRRSPASGAHFDCGKCKWSKTQNDAFEWARENAPASGTAGAAAPDSARDTSASAGERGVFAIESTPPGAEVYVDGDFVGTTPIPEYGLATGKHDVELRKKGFAPWKRQLSVSVGARATVAAEMEPTKVD